jgi:hypothetical protein
VAVLADRTVERRSLGVVDVGGAATHPEDGEQAQELMLAPREPLVGQCAGERSGSWKPGGRAVRQG